MKDLVDHAANNEAILRQRISTGSRDSQDYVNLAHLLADASRYDEAVELYKTAITLAPTNFDRAKMFADLGWALFEAGQPLGAGEAAEKALVLIANEPAIAQLLLIRGSSQVLIAHCVWSEDPDKAARYARLAADSLRKLVTEDSGSKIVAVACGLAARAYLLLEDTENAALVTEKCLKLCLSERDRRVCLSLRAEALRRKNRLDEALEALTEAIRYAKSDANASRDLHFELASIQRLSNRLAEAKESFRSALEIVVNNPQTSGNNEFVAEIHWNLGAIHYDLGEYNNAAFEYGEIIRSCDQNTSLHNEALLWLGHCHYASGYYREARDSYSSFLASSQSSDGQKAEAQEGIAKSHYHSGEYQQAAVEFERSLRYYSPTNPYYFTVLCSLGNCFDGAGDHEKAQECFRKILASTRASESDKESARRGIIESRGMFYSKSRQFEEAAAAFEEALLCYRTDESHYFNILLWLGNCYEALGVYSRAERCFGEILASPHSAELDKVTATESLSRLPRE
jgi:tetratricopeptide (TPR) repeat protein